MAPPLRLGGSRTWTARGPQRLAMGVAERAHDLLHFLPGGDPGPDLDLEGLRNVPRLGAAGGAAEAHVEVRAMLGAGLTVTPGAPAAPVRLGQGAEDDARGQALEPPQEDFAGSGSA